MTNLKQKPNSKTEMGFKARRMRIAKYFEAHRLRTGISLQEAAAFLGVEDVNLIAKYEAGAEPITLDDIFALTSLYNIPPEEILGLIYDISNEQLP